jgi:hypothetical protein
MIAKRDRDPYRPGKRLWVKTKNREIARFAEERDVVGGRGASMGVSNRTRLCG